MLSTNKLRNYGCFNECEKQPSRLTAKVGTGIMFKSSYYHEPFTKG